MKDLTNPAKRILDLVHQVRAKPDQLAMSEVWGASFGLDIDLVKSDPHQVYEKLRLVRGELDLLQELMEETNFSQSLYKPYIQRIRNTINVVNIGASWGNYKGNLTEDTLLALKYCAEIIPSESSVDQEELERILSAIHSLKQEIESSTLSKGMYAFLISQLQIIENAIQNYPINGGDSIRKAFSEGFTNLAVQADKISNENDEDKKEASKVASVWTSLKSVGKEFVEADRIANAYVALIEKGQDASEAVIGLLGGS